VIEIIDQTKIVIFYGSLFSITLSLLGFLLPMTTRSGLGGRGCFLSAATENEQRDDEEEQNEQENDDDDDGRRDGRHRHATRVSRWAANRSDIDGSGREIACAERTGLPVILDESQERVVRVAVGVDGVHWQTKIRRAKEHAQDAIIAEPIGILIKDDSNQRARRQRGECSIEE